MVMVFPRSTSPTYIDVRLGDTVDLYADRANIFRWLGPVTPVIEALGDVYISRSVVVWRLNAENQWELVLLTENRGGPVVGGDAEAVFEPQGIYTVQPNLFTGWVVPETPTEEPPPDNGNGTPSPTLVFVEVSPGDTLILSTVAVGGVTNPIRWRGPPILLSDAFGGITHLTNVVVWHFNEVTGAWDTVWGSNVPESLNTMDSFVQGEPYGINVDREIGWVVPSSVVLPPAEPRRFNALPFILGAAVLLWVMKR